MSTTESAIGVERSAPTLGLRAALSLLAHPLIVLTLCDGALPAAAFFALSYLVCVAHARLRPKWPRASFALAAATLTAAALLLRDSARLLGFADIGLAAPSGLRFVGLSYAYLRAVHALDCEKWSLRRYLRYFFFAPTFFSGPILAPGAHDTNLTGRASSHIAEGAARCVSGLVRITAAQVLLSLIPLENRLAARASFASWPLPLLWLGLFGSGIWLYLNFSGFTEIYIGVSRMCGVRAPENFDNPFAAATITAFWQRWHITLGDWLRGHVYDPVSRRLIAAPRHGMLVASLCAPIVTMVACGAWHALSVSYVAWGLWHGACLGLHAAWTRWATPRLTAGVRGHAAYRAAAWTLTHAAVAASWVLFLPASGDIGAVARLHMLCIAFGSGG